MPTLIRNGILTLAFLWLASPAGATFPGIEIALWDPHFAKEDRSDPQYLRILELARNRQYAEALKIAEQLIAERPEKGTPPILKGFLLYEMKRYREAFFSLQKGRSIQHRHPAIHYGLCQMYRHLGHVELSDRACTIAVNQHPEQPEAHYERALTLAAQGKMEDANRELAEAARLDPENPEYPYQEGLNWNYLNRPDQARKAFEKALALDPGHLGAGYQLGYLLATQNQTEQAENYLNRVYDTRRDDPQVEAARLLLEYLKKHGSAPLPTRVVPARYHLSRSQKLYQEGDYGLALFEIQTAARLAPDNLATQQILVGLASLLIRLDVAQQAVNHLIQITAEQPQLQAKAYQELGDLKLLQGDLAAARQAYRKAVELGDPDQLAQVSLEELPPPGRVKPFHHSDEWLLDPSEALNRKGEAFAHYGMFKRALALYGLALRLNPQNLESKLNTATAYYNSGQYNRAVALLEKILITHPNHPHLFSHRVLLARAYARKKDFKEAARNLELASRIKPEAVRALKSDPVFQALKDHPAFQ